MFPVMDRISKTASQPAKTYQIEAAGALCQSHPLSEFRATGAIPLDNLTLLL